MLLKTYGWLFVQVVLIAIIFTSMKNADSGTKNVLGTPLQTCCTDPMTGFYRDGRCETGLEDHGTHVICAEMTEAFLTFTRSKGNDLSTPRPEYRFPGLKPGDKWCLCALRWREAFAENAAPPVVLERTHEKALEFVSLEDLKACELGSGAKR
jgi:uncharacterized protein (DUF2237 family)